MISCLLKPKDEIELRSLFDEKKRLEELMIASPSDEATATFLQYRNDIVLYVLDKLNPAIQARIKTWTTRRYCDEADAQSLVYEHLLIAVDKYKPERGNCKFTSFFWTVSNRAFANFLNAQKRQKRDPNSAACAKSGEVETPGAKTRLLVSLDEDLMRSNDSTGTLTLADTVDDGKDMTDGANLQSLVKLIYGHCNDQQKTIVALIQQNYTYQEIADTTESTPAAVSRQIQCLKKKLKNELADFRSLI